MLYTDGYTQRRPMFVPLTAMDWALTFAAVVQGIAILKLYQLLRGR